MHEISPTEKLQRERFDAIADRYSEHKGDKWSQAYRHVFINEAMIEGLDLSGMRVLDAMCGNGETTAFLLSKGAHVTGVDISEAEMKHFQEKFPECDAQCASILDTRLASGSFDCVVVVGGLHHLHPNVSEALDEIHRVLKPGGHFCFMEPHAGSLPDIARRFWYRQDTMFAANEESIDVNQLKRRFGEKFEFVHEHYRGNIAYLLVLNSLVFRIPSRWKKYYSGILIYLERFIEKVQGKHLSCYFVGQWRKLDTASKFAT